MMQLSNDELRGASAALSLVSRLLYAEPETGMLRAIVDEEVFEATPFGAGNRYVEEGLSSLRAWCDDARDPSADFDEMVGALQREWLLVFAGLGLPKAPSWASYYTDPGARILSPDTLVVRNWYKRFGLQIERLYNEPDDHLALMLAFVSHLIELEVEAISGASIRWGAAEIQGAQEKFLVEQVLPWLPAWHGNAAKESKSGFFKGLSDILFGLCESYVGRFRVKYQEDRGVFAYERR